MGWAATWRRDASDFLRGAPWRAVGLGVAVGADGAPTRLRAVVVERRGDGVRLARTLPEVATWRELAASLRGLRAVAHLCLLEAPGLLRREVDGSPPTAAELFPGATSATIRMDSLPVEGGALVWAIRRSALASVLADAAGAGLTVAEASLGYAAAAGPLAYLAAGLGAGEARGLDLGGVYLAVDAARALPARVPAGETSGEPVDLDGQGVPPRLLPLFGGGFGLVARNRPADPAERERAGGVLRRLAAARILALGGGLALAALVSGVAGGAYAGRQLDRLKAESHGRLLRAERSREEADLAAATLAAARDLGIAGATRVGKYADELASALPDGIQLTELVVHPPRRETPGRADVEATLFARRRLSLRGTCPDSDACSGMVAAIRALPWVSDVELQSFEQQGPGREVSFAFSVVRERPGGSR